MINKAYKQFLLKNVDELVRSKRDREIILKFIAKLDDQTGMYDEPTIHDYAAVHGQHVIGVRDASAVVSHDRRLFGRPFEENNRLAAYWARNINDLLEGSQLEDKAFREAMDDQGVDLDD